MKRSLKRLLVWMSVGVTLATLITACNWRSGPREIELTLVGYAVPSAAHDAIIPKFVEQWKKDHDGQNIIFSQSYGGSGSQTRAVIDGLDADIVHLAIGADVNKLVKSGLVKPDWNARIGNQGIVAETTAVIVTRSGNPKNIKSFADLARPDIKWVTASPKTSGGARWNYYALWNEAKQTGRNESQALALVTQAFKNVAVLTKDARESVDAFAKQGQGDALVNYENEVILAQQKGENLDFVVPAINIAIDTPATVVDKYVDKHGTRAAAEAFVQFLLTPAAQEEFAKVGFRPIGTQQAAPKLTKISAYGGWEKAQKTFQDGGTFDQIEAAIGKQ
jgi:sulfate/thiosulfate transport system substrate-binding protein